MFRVSDNDIGMKAHTSQSNNLSGGILWTYEWTAGIVLNPQRLRVRHCLPSIHRNPLPCKIIYKLAPYAFVNSVRQPGRLELLSSKSVFASKSTLASPPAPGQRK